MWLYKLLAEKGGLKSVALAAVLKYDGDDVQIHFTFHRPTIDALKALRVGARWDKARSVWVAPEEAAHPIVRMLEALGYVWEVTPWRSAEIVWSDALLERAPDRLRSTLYRAVAQVVHPDHQGDEAMMRELAESWHSMDSSE